MNKCRVFFGHKKIINNREVRKVKKIILTGATGDIGEQVLQVVESNPKEFKLCAISANTNYEKLKKIADKYKPQYVVVQDENAYNEFVKKYPAYKASALCGIDGIRYIIRNTDFDVLVEGCYGIKGVFPIIEAIKADKIVCASDAFVCAGELLTNYLKESKGKFFPIDSEHAAVMQCLVGEKEKYIKRIILSCSGGPFWNYKGNLDDITPKQVLENFTWERGGNKIRIDSATLLNKGNELLEAKYLFNLKKEQIDIMIHPQSVIQSFVEYIDGAIKAQIFNKNLISPILYTLSYPERFNNYIEEFDINKLQNLNFYKVDISKYPCLELAIMAGEKGGNYPLVLNSADVVAGQAFIDGKIRFTDIPRVIEKVISKTAFVSNPSYEELLQLDIDTRIYTQEMIDNGDFGNILF